jgi:hypothetical protein
MHYGVEAQFRNGDSANLKMIKPHSTREHIQDDIKGNEAVTRLAEAIRPFLQTLSEDFRTINPVMWTRFASVCSNLPKEVTPWHCPWHACTINHGQDDMVDGSFTYQD